MIAPPGGAPRSHAKSGPRALGLAALACAALALGSCGRQPPHFVQRGADSTAASAVDSFAVRVGETLDQWESQGGSGAASQTVRLVLDDLRRHPDRSLNARCRVFLDSCGFSAEIAGGPELAAINFFARSDPAGSSWPYLIWRDRDAVRQQAIEGGGMRLLDLKARGRAADSSAAIEEGSTQDLAVIFGRPGPRGVQPVVIAWRLAPGGTSWSLTQTLGPDSLGGVGTAAFVPGSDGEIGLEARTYRVTPGFDECATCPHVFRTLSFDWLPAGFTKVGEEAAPSPYYSFVQLIAALAVNDHEMAARFVADQSLLDSVGEYDWTHSKGLWRVAPGSSESADAITFFRGAREAYKVRFALRGGVWVVTDLQPTPRTVE